MSGLMKAILGWFRPNQSSGNSKASNALQKTSRSSSESSTTLSSVSAPVLTQSSSKIFIRLTLIQVSEEKRVEVDKDMTGKELKEFIFAKLSQELDVHQMSLTYQGTLITKQNKLSSLNIVTGTELHIIQQKISVAEVSAIFADANGVDPLTDEVGTAKMSCGHHIGKNSMTVLIRSLITSNKFEIRCPNYNDDQPCLALWEYAICKKIGVFTKSEIIQFQNGLSSNWMKQYAKTCPQCKSSVSKYGLETNRVRCPKCKFGDFCYLCLNKWKGQNNKFCGNEECIFLRQTIQNCAFNKKFMLKDSNDPNKRTEYFTPQYRYCVHCFALIEHRVACKHMECAFCKKSFCWVCLSVPKNGKYPCGEFNDYCGKVAQRQNYGSVSI